MQRGQRSAPLRERRSIPLKSVPVTTTIIAINALIFLAMTFTGSSPILPSVNDLAKWGANNGLQNVLAQPWRMLTATYVHVGILHISLNMWCLWNLGVLAERIFDRWTYFLTYTFCGIMASLASIVIGPMFHHSGVSAGASGAIFGLAGALITALYLGHLPIHPSALKATLKSLVSFAVYNLIFGEVVPFIDNSAHVGGLVTGLALGALFAPHLMSAPSRRRAWNSGILVVALCVFLGMYFLARHFALWLVFRR